MEEYKSKKNGRILHLIHRIEEPVEGRRCLIDAVNTLQIAIGAGFKPGHKFTGPHYHLPQNRVTDNTMESWVIVRGSVKVSMYDVDQSFLADAVLRSGDCYVYFDGGHGFEILEAGTRFVEVKNGPYFGQQRDKEYIKDSA